MIDLIKQMIDGLIGAVVGGFIAGYFSLRAIKRTFQEQRKIDSEKTEQEEKALLQALHDELDVILKLYEKAVGNRLDELKAGQAFFVYCGISQDYFSVYQGNTDKIGCIRNAELRYMIVSVYTQAMGLIDGFKLNNDFVRQHEHFDTRFQASRLETDRELANRFLKPCLEIAPKLKQEHFAFKENVSKLLVALRKSN
jgi:uncharacterized protein YktB (UPF0637 family)